MLPQSKIGVAKKGYADAVAEINRQKDDWKNSKTKISDYFDQIEKGTLTSENFLDVLKDENKYVRDNVRIMIDDKKTFSDLSDEKEKYFKDADKNVDSKKWTTGLKSMASSALTTVGNMAINAVGGMIAEQLISWGLQGLDYVINYDDHVIEKGQEAKDTILQQTKEYESQRSTLKDLTSTYATLAKGVKVSGNQIKNVSLSNDEFEQFLNTSNQIANTAPSMVKTYDNEGNAILNLGSNTEEINKKVEDYINLQRDLTHISVKENIQNQYEGISKETEKIQKELDNYSSQMRDLEDTRKNLESLGNFTTTPFDVELTGSEYKKVFEALSKYDIIPTYLGDNTETGKARYNIDVSGLDTKELSDLNSQFEGQIESINSQIGLTESQISSKKLLFNSKWKELIPSLQSYVDSSNMFDELATTESDKIKSGIKTMISNIDYSTIADDVNAAGSIDSWIDQQLIAPMVSGTGEVRKAWEGLFELEDKRGQTTIKDFAKQRNEYLKTIAQSQGISMSEMATRLGYASRNEDGTFTWNTKDEIYRAVNKTGLNGEYGRENLREYLNNLSGEDYEIAIDIILNGEENITSISKLQDEIAKAQKNAENEKYSLTSMQENVTSAQIALSSFSSVLSETTSAGGLSADNISILKNSFSDLEDVDLNSLFLNTTNGVKLNIDALKNLSKQQNDMKSKEFAKAIELQNKAIAEQKKLTEDATKSEEERQEAQSNYEDALADLASLQQAQSQWQAVAKQQKELFSDYSAWQRAQSTENAGDKYLNMVTGLKNAKDAWDKGLVGTDDFKTFAAMISPTGSDDAKNFEENYAKAKRYLTDSVKGVKNFLNDLDAKGLAEFNDETKQWTYNIEDMAAAARKMGMGKDFMSAMFGRLEDYGFHNNFISSVDDGISKVNELSTALAKEEQNLAELNKYDPGNKTAIDASMEKIQQYKNDINEVIKQMSTVSQTAVEEAQANYEGAVNAIQALDEQRQKVLKSDMGETEKKAVYNQLTGQMNTLASGAGTTVEAVLELDDTEFKKQIQNEKEYAQQLLTATPDNPAKPDFGEDTEAAKNYESALGKVQEANKNNNETLKQSLETLSQYNSEQLKSIDLNDNAYDGTFEGAKEAEQALDNIVSSLGLSTEEAQMLATVLESMGLIKPEVDTSQMTNDITSVINNLTQDQVVTFKAQLDDGSFAQIEATKDEDGTITYTANIDGVQYEITNVTENQDGTITYTANIDGVETELTTIKDEEATITYNEVEGETIEDPKDETRTITTEETVTVKPDPNPMEVETSDATVAVTPDPTPMEVPVKEAKVPVTPDPASVEVNVIAKGKEEADALSTSVTNLKGKTVEVVANVHGEKETYNLKDAIDSLYPRTVQEKANVFGIEQVQALVDTISSLKSKSVTITTNYVTTHSSSGGALTGRVPKHTGTMLSPAHASGTAYNVLNMKPAFARGNVTLQKNEQALVNEEQINGHSESIVRNGRWFLIPGGAHVENLKKGDLIFSAKQTDALLKYGKISGHARAYAQGTLAYDGMPAHADTISGGGGFQGGISSSKTANSLNDASSNIKKASSDLSSAAKKTSEAADDTKEAFDYIQIKLERLQTKYDNYIRNAEAAFSLSSKLSNYNKANSTIAEQIKANEQGAARYKKEANSVGLDKSIAKLVQSGTIDIKKYDENTQKLISDYQNWYELMKDCENAAKDLKVQQKELAQTKIDTIADRYSMYAGYADARTNYLQGELDYREAAGYSNVSKRQKYIYDTSIKQEQYKINQNQTIAAILQKEIDAQLKSGVMKKGDEAWYAAQEQLRGLDEEIYKSKTAIAEYNQELRNINTTKLQRAFDKISRWADQLKGLLNLKEARGQNVTEQDYMSQITANNDQILAQYSLLQNYLDEQANYEYGSEKWQELAEKIAGTKNNINDLLVSNEELQNSIVEERWESFNKLNEDIDLAVTELDYLRNALNESVDPLGNLTDDGQANIALIGKEMVLQKQRIADYNKALEKLDEQYKNGNVDQNEYNEKQKEFRQVIRESSDSVRDYEDSLIDLWKSQIQARNDALQEEIDLRQKALESKKKYYDYDKQLKSQTKEINLLKSQIAALEGVSDAASKAKLAKLKAQLKESEEDLADIKYEHEYDLKVTGYDTLKDDVQKQLDDTLDELEISSELQQNVVDSMLGNIKTNYETAYTDINNLITESGLSISDTATLAIDSFKDMESAVNALSEAIKAIPEVKPTQTAEDVKTSEIVTNKGTGGKTTTDAEKAAGQKENTKNTVGTLPPSNQGSQSGKATKITLSSSSITLKKGESKTLTVTPTPANALVEFKWSVKDSKIASVSSSGVVKGKKKGSTYITVKDTKSGLSAKCTVKVTGTTKPKKPNSGSTSGSGTNTSIWSGIAKDTSDKGNKSLNISKSIVDRMKYNGYASDRKARTQLWKNLKGSGTYSETAAQNIWMLEKLKKAGYSKGGIIDDYIPADMLGFLGKAIVHNGDSGIIGINPGETVLTEEFTKNLKPTVDVMKNFTDTANVYGNAKSPVIIDSLITINGNVDKDVMDDLKALGKQLANNRSFVDSMTDKISLNIAKDANKAGIVRKIR